jgi:multidrug efflux system membrane fusion protein
LLLRFKVPEREASQIRVGMPASFRIREEEREYAAKIVHVDASADETTRMVSITAEVRDSQEAALRPGAFAEVVVPVSSPRMSPVVPQTAIRPSEKGFLAFVVENDTAQERIISVGMRTADGRVEVLSGLKAGEIIVVRGAEALRNGVPVRQAKTAASEPAAIPKKPS